MSGIPCILHILRFKKKFTMPIFQTATNFGFLNHFFGELLLYPKELQNGRYGFLMHLDDWIIERSRRAMTRERWFHTGLIRRKCPMYT